MAEPADPAPPPEPGKKPRVDPSAVDDLVDRTKHFLGDVANEYVKRPVDNLLRWTLGRVISYLVAAALFITAAVFLLIAGVEALKTSRVPDFAAYLALGIVGVIAGLIVLRVSRPPAKD